MQGVVEDRAPRAATNLRCSTIAALVALRCSASRRKCRLVAVVQDGAAGGDADGAAEIAHQVEQPRGQLQPFGGEAAQRQSHRRRHGELLGEAAQRLRDQQFAPAPVMGDRRKVPHAEAEQASPNIISQRRSIRRAQKV